MKKKNIKKCLKSENFFLIVSNFVVLFSAVVIKEKLLKKNINLKI